MKNKKHSKAETKRSTKLEISSTVKGILKRSGAYKYTVQQPGTFPVLDILVVGRRVARVTKPGKDKGFEIRLTAKPERNTKNWKKVDCKEFPYTYGGQNAPKALAMVFKDAAKL